MTRLITIHHAQKNGIAKRIQKQTIAKHTSSYSLSHMHDSTRNYNFHTSTTSLISSKYPQE